jgi:hypothetical protein
MDFTKGTNNYQIYQILLHEKLFDYWYNMISEIERIPENGSRNGVDEIIVSEKMREELKTKAPDVGPWTDILLDFIESADFWTFVKEVGKRQDEKK